jgi:hypothetical protein
MPVHHATPLSPSTHRAHLRFTRESIGLMERTASGALLDDGKPKPPGPVPTEGCRRPQPAR